MVYLETRYEAGMSSFGATYGQATQQRLETTPPDK
jgi:hypothetical protein